MTKFDLIYDQQIFTMQAYGGISRYICELAVRVQRDSGLCVNVTAPLYVNEHLREFRGRGLSISGIFVPKTRLSSPLAVRAGRVLGEVVLRAQSPRLVHATYYQPAAKLPAGTRLVVTVHDMIEEILPEFADCEQGRKNKAEAVRRADLLVCVSENTKRDLMRILGTDEKKIVVIPLGTTFRPSSSAAHHRPYLLFVGPRRTYKNFEGLLQAYACSAVLRESFDLVCFGGSPFSAAEQQRIADSGVLQDRVVWRGGDDAALAGWYSGAAAFVNPSRYEGFGIPVLEAMACGCPVACSAAGSHQEVAGEAAVYFHPDNVEEMRSVVEHLVSDASGTQRRVTEGLTRASRMTWDATATATAAVYRALL